MIKIKYIKVIKSTCLILSTVIARNEAIQKNIKLKQYVSFFKELDCPFFNLRLRYAPRNDEKQKIEQPT
jgi:hypothetical protein